MTSINMDNQIQQPQPSIFSNTIIKSSPALPPPPPGPSSNSGFWIFLAVLSLVIFIAIIVHLCWNNPAISSYIKNLTQDNSKPSTPSNNVVPSSSQQDSSPMTMASSLSSPYEITNNTVSSTHNQDYGDDLIGSGGGNSTIGINTNNANNINTNANTTNFNPYSDTSLDTALNNATKSNNSQTTQTPQADDTYSSNNKSNNKTGWCYIGEERGYRTCLQVGENDDCMSGDIFPSRDICVNPSLRA